MDDLFSSTPFVAGSDTSRERARIEDTNGTASKRRKHILELLRVAGPAGMTWQEVAEKTGLHHGQVSGALSVMHKDGWVASLRIKRNRCHPYIHAQWAQDHPRDMVQLEPAQTLAGRKQEATQTLIDAVRAYKLRGLGTGNILTALDALDALDEQ